jgi:hypothetical protein
VELQTLLKIHAQKSNLDALQPFVEVVEHLGAEILELVILDNASNHQFICIYILY